MSTKLEDLDILVIGSCNTDLISYCKRLPKVGETVHGSKFTVGFGGKGGNQCMAAAKLGASTALVAKLGNDSFGENYLKNLQNHGVNTTFVKIINNSSGVAQIAVSNEGENHIIIVAGANNELNASDVLEAEGAIEKAKVVLFQFETPLSTTHKGLEICAKYSCISVVNGAPGLKNLNPEILQLADIFCVNETEAELITEFKIQNIVPDSMKAATKLVSMGCKLPIITLGDKGVVFTTKNAAQPIHIPVEHVSAVDTTGAGDAFIGGLAYFLAKYEHLSMETVIKKACEIAKFSVQKFGTQTSFPERKDVLTILFVES